MMWLRRPMPGDVAAFRKRRPSSVGWGAYLVVAGALALTLLMGLVSATGQWQLSAGFIALFAAVFLVGMAVSRVSSRYDAFFWLPFAVLLVASPLLASTGLDLRFAQELVVYAAAPFIVAALWPWMPWSGALRAAVILVLLFSVVSIVSTALGRSHLVPAAYTFAYNFKPFLLLALGVCVAWTARTQRVFWWIVAVVWPILVLAGLFQWLAPGAYQQLFGEFQREAHPFLPGLTRAKTMFHHPAMSATIAAALAFAAQVRAMQSGRWRWWAVTLGYVVVIVMSGQRQELLAWLMTAMVAFFLWRKPVSLGWLAGVAVIAGVTTLAALYPLMHETIDAEVQNWGLGQYRDVSNIRAILYEDAIKLANQAFPWGTGLGTFGSAGAVKFDLSQYIELGYGAFWWFGKRNVLMDAFWTRYIAETGWIGTLLMVSIYVVVLQRTLKWLRRTLPGSDDRMIVLLGISGLLFLLLASPTSFGLAESLQGFLPLVFVGLAWRVVHPAMERSRLQGARRTARAFAHTRPMPAPHVGGGQTGLA